MSEASTDKVDKAPVLHYVVIVILVLAIAAMGFLTVRKYLAKEPTVNIEEARLKALTDAVNKNPNDLDARLKLAYAYQMFEEYTLAREQYMEAIKISPDDLAANYNLGLICKVEKKYSEAEKYLSKVLSLKPEHVLGAIAMGEIYLEQNQYDKVIEVVDRALKRFPDKADLRILKAKALEKQGDVAGAKREYKEVLKYVPDNREATEALAKLK